jgi:hypothetical protein
MHTEMQLINLKKRYHSRDVGIAGRIIFKEILKK